VRYVTLAWRVAAALALVRKRVAAPYSILAAVGAVARKPLDDNVPYRKLTEVFA
jgi:hypothetical protein